VARCSPVAGSLIVHGAIALVVVLARCSRPEVQPDRRQRIAIDLVTPAPLVSPTPAVPQPVTQASVGSSPGNSLAPPRALRHAHSMATHAAASSRRTVEATMRIEPPRSEASEPRAVGETGETGEAAGPGSGDRPGPGGRGGGIGFGIGGWNTSVAAAPLPVPPAAPPAPEPAKSRARPPRLIYPARDREALDSLLFVARLTIDPDGFVIGARLVRGVGGVRDDQATNAVWRFRYSPALDDDGRPIQATIEQRFLVD